MRRQFNDRDYLNGHRATVSKELPSLLRCHLHQLPAIYWRALVSISKSTARSGSYSVQRWLIAALVSFSSFGSASAITETLIPLPGWQIGVVRDQKVLCFDLGKDVNGRTAWNACTSEIFLNLASNATRVLGNERTVGVLYQNHIDFFDESGEPKPRARLNFKEAVSPSSFVNGNASTESDVVRIEHGRFKVSNALDPESQMDAPFRCDEVQGGKTYAYGWGALAVVHAEKVIFRDIRRVKNAPRRMQCLPSKIADFEIPEMVEEVFIYRREYIGLRRDKTVKFYVFDPSIGWGPADAAGRNGLQRVPELQLP